MSAQRSVLVYGAYGHTGRFVVSELLRRGWDPILSGRDRERLAQLAADFPALQQRVATVEDPESLDRALSGAVAVINCAGPFMDTALPLIEAALRAPIHYLDISAEQPSTLEVHGRFAAAAQGAGVIVMPAMGFYGGLADLLATAALGDWVEVESIEIAVGLDSWFPTVGTRKTGARNTARRQVVSDGRLVLLADPAPTRAWDFPAPFGTQEVVALPLSEIITISSHLRSAELHSYMNLTPLKDLRNPHTPPPTATDASGRSAQTFVVEALLRQNGQTRRACACGRDIYAITAPLVVEALQRMLDGRCAGSGVLAPGAAFAARDFLTSLPLQSGFR